MMMKAALQDMPRAFILLFKPFENSAVEAFPDDRCATWILMISKHDVFVIYFGRQVNLLAVQSTPYSITGVVPAGKLPPSSRSEVMRHNST